MAPLRAGLAALAAAAAASLACAPAAAQPRWLDPARPINIVAIGASNTWGWGIDRRNAYPARLEAMLRARGYDARVRNAGVNFATTDGMLKRVDSRVPDGTHIVIIQPGGNDVRFFRSEAHRAANIERMVARLSQRRIHAIVYDPAFPREHYQWDLIHLTSEAHEKIAADLLAYIARIAGPPPARR